MKVEERAAQIWPVLALAARNRQVLTYEIVGKLISVSPPGLGQLLEPIQSYCLLQKFPPLSVLVVSQNTGEPGGGFVAASEIAKAQQEVFRYDWSFNGCPSADELSAAVERLPSNGRSLAALQKTVDELTP
jgi:hypothetical protein